MTPDEIAEKFGARNGKAKCPAHADCKESLSIEPGNDGRTLIHCFAGCKLEDILIKKGLTVVDLFSGNGKQAKSTIAAFYDYRDEEGAVVYQKVRYVPKDFVIRRPDGKGGWIYKKALDGVRRVLYRMPDLIAADLNTTVFVVEGEKDVDRLVARVLVATTSPFGGSKTTSQKKWLAEFNEHFRNRKVAIIPDNDETGIEFAWYVAEQILSVAAEVRIVELPDVPPKGDVSDFLDRGGTRELLLELVEKAPKLTELKIQFRKDDRRAKEAQRGGASVGSSTTAPKRLADVMLEISRKLDALSSPTRPDELSVKLQAIAADLPPLNSVDLAILRDVIVKKLGELGISAPAKLADALLGAVSSSTTTSDQGHEVVFEEIDPASGPVTTSEMLEEVRAIFERYAILPAHGSVATALWVLNSYSFDSFDICPILAMTSPTPQCGKTRVLELLSVVTRRPLAASNCTPSTVFRAMEQWKPTLLIDEMDAFLGGSEELRGILNAGHSRRLAYVLRTEGDQHEPRRFSVWGPKGVALIGKLPNTLEDRSILIRMRRRARGESIERARLERLFVELRPLREKLMRWADDNAKALRTADPTIPRDLSDRAADNWRPLLAIADLAGGDWPKLARDGATALSAALYNETVGIMLLEDVRTLFADLAVDKLASETIAERLGKMEERPWSEWGKAKKPITKNNLASLLKPFDISPKTVWLGKDTSKKGYDLADFKEAFDRYLGPDTAPSAEEGVSKTSGRQEQHGSGAEGPFATVRSENDLTAQETRKPLADNDPGDLTDEKAVSDGGKGAGPVDGPPTELF